MEVVNNTNPNPNTNTDSGSGLGFFLGAILLIIFAFLLFYYGIPAIRNNLAPAVTEPQAQNQSQPTMQNNEGDTNITVPVPDNVDVSLDQEERP